MRFYLCFSGLFGLVLISSSFGQNEKKDDASKFVGNWLMIDGEAAGKKIPPELFKNNSYRITNKKLISEKDQKPQKSFSYSVNSNSNPKIIDLTSEQGDLIQGIYKLEMDILKICISAPGEKRPKEFKTQLGSQEALIILKRMKDSK